jgi:hypothetical protein
MSKCPHAFSGPVCFTYFLTYFPPFLPYKIVSLKTCIGTIWLHVSFFGEQNLNYYYSWEKVFSCHFLNQFGFMLVKKSHLLLFKWSNPNLEATFLVLRNWIFFFQDRVLLCSTSWPQINPLASASKCWNYRCAPPHLARNFIFMLRKIILNFTTDV